VLKTNPEKVLLVRLMKEVTNGRRDGMLPIMMAILRSMPAHHDEVIGGVVHWAPESGGGFDGADGCKHPGAVPTLELRYDSEE